MKKFLLIEGCNFIDYPIGGYLSFAKQMISAYGAQIALVGVSTDETPIGKWTKKEINGVEFDFYSIRKVYKSSKKPLVPERIKLFFALIKNRRKIFKIGINSVFIQTPEILFSITGIRNIDICTRIPGVENPIAISRYSYARYFAKLFDLIFFHHLKKTNLILATADNNAIKDFIKRSNNKLDKNKVFQFPSRVDTNVFYPQDKYFCRKALNLENDIKIIVTTGRLNTLKGWEFMLDSFKIFKKQIPNSIFIFLGDGEDRVKVTNYIEENNLVNDVLIKGRLSHKDISLYLNASDIYVMGSLIEGWATSLVEAIACAKPVVCTNFSSAKELVSENLNGYVVSSRDITEFATKMLSCENLEYKNLLNKSKEMYVYSTSELSQNLNNLWKIN